MSGLWGIDVGGTKLEGVILAKNEPRRVITRIRVPTESRFGFEHIVNNIGQLVQQMREQSGLNPTHIGFGTPGIVDPQTKLMKNCNTTCLNGRPLQSELERTLSVKATLANDANCFALAEAKFGAAQGAKVVFGVIMGTGVGGGIVINGQVLSGCQGIAGEWGHNVLDPQGIECYCGKRGCVETIISGPALERFHREQSGISKSLQEIALGVDDHSRGTLAHLCQWFGKALSVVINILDPDIVVLGGGVSNIKNLYSKGVDAVRQNTFNNSLQTKIVVNELGDSGGVFGAALLTME